QMSLNTTQFVSDINESFEKIITYFYFSIGFVSTILSMLTFYLIIRESSFFNIDVRILLLNLQISAFFNNFHYCILFVPFLFPYLGGGFCTGILCMLGGRFHEGMCLWLASVVLLCASFIVLLFARLQTLLHPWSRMKLRFPARL
ncbi:hypothetical protein PMAYCL1PPCAC_15471, partial [Pristionchus mayeri]